MNHIGTQTIETERLILRRFEPDDAGQMYRNWASDPDVTRYLTWPPHESAAASRAILEDWVQHYKQGDYLHWAIVLKATGEPIGSIAVVNLDEASNQGEVGYCIGKAWWRQGIMSEALRAVIGELFAHVGLSRVTARHDPRNVHSGSVMRKCGMTYTHTTKQQDRNNCGVCDADYYCITPDQLK